MKKLLFSSLPALVAVGLLASGCGSSDDESPAAGGGSDTRTLSFKLTDAGCSPAEATVVAGPVNFEVTNAGAAKVRELEVLGVDQILAEAEDLDDGETGSFSLNLKAGKYVLFCPGGERERGILTVTGAGAAQSNPKLDAAVARYRAYVERNTDELVAATEPFVAAVIAGDVARAKALYPAARIPYERVEPVAEAFGELDPRIDARANDVPAEEFAGFHKIEQALWVKDTTAGMAPVARRLLADVKELRVKARTVTLQAAAIANGANELLGEVSASKITGEEERYSHIDLVDFEANVEGSQAAFEAVEPLLRGEDPELADEIESRFDEVYAALAPYRRGDGFVPYTELSNADTRALARAIDALAEPLSQVPAQIVQ